MSGRGEGGGARAVGSRCCGVPSSSAADLSKHAGEAVDVCQALTLTRVKVCVGWGGGELRRLRPILLQRDQPPLHSAFKQEDYRELLK